MRPLYYIFIFIGLWCLSCNSVLFKFVAYGFSRNETYAAIRIVNEVPKNDPLDLGIESENDANVNSNGDKDKKVVLHPTLFSGPEQFEKLKGTCFTALDDKYKYKFCPFSNITQEELQTGDNQYSVILGVWGEWIIENNTFASLHYLRGSKCGSGLERSTKIHLRCGDRHNFIKVIEPKKCLYEGWFETPLACGANAVVVYPRLSEQLQMEWDQIETEKYYDILTSKGYNEALNRIFHKAGLLLSSETRESLRAEELSNSCDCGSENENLKKKIIELEASIKEKELQILELKKGNGSL